MLGAGPAPLTTLEAAQAVRRGMWTGIPDPAVHHPAEMSSAVAETTTVQEDHPHLVATAVAAVTEVGIVTTDVEEADQGPLTVVVADTGAHPPAVTLMTI